MPKNTYTSPAKPSKKPRSRKKIWIIAGSVLAVLLLIVFLLWAYVNGKLNLLSRSDHIDYSASLDESLLEDDSSITDRLAGIDVLENGGDITPPDGDVNPAPKGVYNILLVGTDERSEEFERARADSLMLLSVDTKNNTLKLMSFERALGVSVPDHGDDWLTHAFAYGGPDLVLQTLRSYFKVDVSRYVRVNFTVFETAITDIGGVEVELTESEADYLNGIAGQKKWTAGKTRFDGPTALVYSRIRHLDDDWHRVERQRKVIQGAIDQALTLSPAKIDLLANKLLPMIATNLSNGDIWRLIGEVPSFAGVTAEQMTVPAKGTYWGSQLDNGRIVVACDFEKNADIINNFLYGDGSMLKAQLDDSSSDSTSSSSSSR